MTTKNRRALMDAIEVALKQCTNDREFAPLLRYILAQSDAKRAARKPKAKKTTEAKESELRG